ncbi:3-oxoacyl-[acyl-carrier-protein] reductase FabG [bioreactor metagenome]|uniref:3-oxoacyl-[acyl-carrier-protein] reductase FabG n=1 Tax=bioreactor metagenome TaxID=1076179 RepID=A0A645BRG9_9ZZZZ|nr:SDR family oxidoreductase [Candidatus Metalachnospira sp.]
MKTAVITGSSRGIGKAISEEFCKNGYFVVLNASQSAKELDETYREFKNKGYSCEAVLANVMDYDECRKLFTYNADVLVNNAGISYIGLFSDMKPADWKKVIDTNLISVINCTHIALPYMLKMHSGSIINISSMWGEKGASCEAVYSASKGAINAFTKSMAKEVGPSGIRVNAVSCGVIETKMNACFSDEEKETLKDEISLMRFGTPDEVAKLVYFLADSEKSGYVNGQVISIDGGII